MIDLLDDNKNFQKKYGFDEKPLTKDQLHFRMTLLYEEFMETWDAYTQKDPEELVDGHIDMIVIILGNLHLAGVDIGKAWREVYFSNMSKTRGTKPGREASGGFDVYKEPGKFIKASHKGNHGDLGKLLDE